MDPFTYEPLIYYLNKQTVQIKKGKMEKVKNINLSQWIPSTSNSEELNRLSSFWNTFYGDNEKRDRGKNNLRIMNKIIVNPKQWQ